MRLFINRWKNVMWCILKRVQHDIGFFLIISSSLPISKLSDDGICFNFLIEYGIISSILCVIKCFNNTHLFGSTYKFPDLTALYCFKNDWQCLHVQVETSPFKFLMLFSDTCLFLFYNSLTIFKVNIVKLFADKLKYVSSKGVIFRSNMSTLQYLHLHNRLLNVEFVVTIYLLDHVFNGTGDLSKTWLRMLSPVPYSR